MSTDRNQTTSGLPRTGKGRVIALITVAAIAVGGAFGVQAVADSKTYQHIKVAAGWHDGGHGGWRHGGPGRFSDMTEAEIADRITRMVKHVAIEIDATDAQEEKIIALVTAVARDMMPLRDSMHAARAEIRDLLLADEIDRAALEKMRAARIAQADEISKTLVNAVADVAEVLTPGQRRILEERMREFRGMHRDGGHRRHDRG